MTLPVVRYPLDPTGLSPNNFVSGEQHILGTKSGSYHPVAPFYGPYYNDDITLKVYHGATLLVKGVDYWSINLIQDATALFNKEVCEVLIIKNRQAGDTITLYYQNLGGLYQNHAKGIADLYAATLADNRPIDWSTGVVNKPGGYNPAYHLHMLSDVVGWEPLIVAIERLINVLALRNVPAFEALIDYVNAKFTGVNNVIGNTTTTDIQAMLALPPSATEASITNNTLVTVTNLLIVKNWIVNLLSSKANLASPAFSGTPTAPTQNADSNSNALATTAFVVRATAPATDETKGTVELNTGVAPTDATDTTSALTAAGLNTLLTSVEPNALKDALKVAMPPTEVSLVPGNLIERRGDGLYYGIVAPPNLTDIYIDAVNGVDTNDGTRALPLKTLLEALSRGTTGLDRNIRLHEGQDHWVTPRSSTSFRGGHWTVMPYGPLSDALPPVVGDSVFMQAAALDLNTRIVSEPMISSGTVETGFFQTGFSLYPSSGAVVEVYCVNFVCAPSNGTTDPFGAYSGTYHHPDSDGSWFLRSCTVTLLDPNSSFYSGGKFATAICTLDHIKFVGTGKFAACNSKNFTLNWWGGIYYESDGVTVRHGSTDEVLRSYLGLAPAVMMEYGDFITNLPPAQGKLYAKSYLDLDLVQNYPLATPDEAAEGIRNDRYLTPALIQYALVDLIPVTLKVVSETPGRSVYQITNFDFELTYTLSPLLGTIVRDADQVTYTYPGGSQTAGFYINRRLVALTVYQYKSTGPVIYDYAFAAGEGGVGEGYYREAGSWMATGRGIVKIDYAVTTSYAKNYDVRLVKISGGVTTILNQANYGGSNGAMASLAWVSITAVIPGDIIKSMVYLWGAYNTDQITGGHLRIYG